MVVSDDILAKQVSHATSSTGCSPLTSFAGLRYKISPGLSPPNVTTYETNSSGLNSFDSFMGANPELVVGTTLLCAHGSFGAQ